MVSNILEGNFLLAVHLQVHSDIGFFFPRNYLEVFRFASFKNSLGSWISLNSSLNIQERNANSVVLQDDTLHEFRKASGKAVQGTFQHIKAYTAYPLTIFVKHMPKYLELRVHLLMEKSPMITEKRDLSLGTTIYLEYAMIESVRG